MRDQLTDEMLTQAAKQVAAHMSESLPSPEECHHVFSQKFEQDMQGLISQTNRIHYIHRLLRRCAIMCLVVIMSMSIWLAIDAGARAAFVQWIKTVYEQSVVYEFFHSSQEQSNNHYELGWVPEGYAMKNVVSGEMVTTVIYQDDKEPIYFIYENYMDGGSIELFPGKSDVEPIMVNGIPGEFYQSKDPNESNSLVWFDKEDSVLFSISGFTDKETMVQMAESIKTISLSK